MPDGSHQPEPFARTGDFFFKVWRRDNGAWNWRLRVEVVESGEWEIFESMQEALWFMRQHMTPDADDDADVDVASPVAGEAATASWECLEEQAELEDWPATLRHAPSH